MMNKPNVQCKKKGRGLVVLILMVVGSLFLSGCGAQAAPKTYRVGILSGLDYFANIADGFKAKMTELGYVENQNIIYDTQNANPNPAEYKRILQEFVTDEVDLIFVFPTEAALEAKAVTQGTDIPVLFANAFIEGVDLVESVRQPGGNITGVRYPGPDLAAKSLEILLEMAPQTKRVWVPYLQGYPSVPSLLEAMRSVADSLGVTLVEVPATSTADIEADLQARTQSADPDIDTVLYIYEPISTRPGVRTVVNEFATKYQIPVGNDTLFRLEPDNVQVGRLAALLADKILKGTSAGTIPVLSPEPFLLLNYKAAQELGLTVSEGLLSQANEIIR